MNARAFLLVNLALAFYLVGAIWAHEVDIFRSWKLVGEKDFRRIQAAHWKKLRYWVLAPLGLALAGSVALVGYHPRCSPAWAIWGNLGSQLVSLLLTALFWGRWQAQLSRDPRGPASPYLQRFLATHWIRTFLINLYGLILLVWAIQVMA
jgi:hypothetical protein